MFIGEIDLLTNSDTFHVFVAISTGTRGKACGDKCIGASETCSSEPGCAINAKDCPVWIFAEKVRIVQWRIEIINRRSLT